MDEDSVGLDDVSSLNKPVADMLGWLALPERKKKKKKLQIQAT